VTLAVVPFRQGKSRLGRDAETRRALALAMLGDVLAACVAFGEAVVITPDEEAASLARDLGAAAMADPGGGQGGAVAAALAGRGDRPVLVVNSDLPCVVPHDLHALVEVAELPALGLVEAADGTTNALALPAPGTFAPLYGPGSARRFADHARALGLDSVSVALPNLADDVDTSDDLERVALRAGPRTQAALARVVGKAVA